MLCSSILFEETIYKSIIGIDINFRSIIKTMLVSNLLDEGVFVFFHKVFYLMPNFTERFFNIA